MTITPVHRGPRVTLWLLRGVAAVQLLMMAFQPILAGLFLDGELDAIAVHSLSGSLLTMTDMVQVVMALVFLLAERGKAFPLALSVLMWLPIGIQIGMGHERNLLIHIPLGILLLVLQVLLFVWLMGKSAREPRTWGIGRGSSQGNP